jgi:hypothetical protein
MSATGRGSSSRGASLPHGQASREHSNGRADPYDGAVQRDLRAERREGEREP